MCLDFPPSKNPFCIVLLEAGRVYVISDRQLLLGLKHPPSGAFHVEIGIPAAFPDR